MVSLYREGKEGGGVGGLYMYWDMLQWKREVGLWLLAGLFVVYMYSDLWGDALLPWLGYDILDAIIIGGFYKQREFGG